MRAASAAGWGTWIRTKTNRVRVCCATVTPFPNGLPSVINSLCGYPGKSHAAGPGQITARWSQRSTRLILPLASAEAEAFLQSARPGRTASRHAEAQAAISIVARGLQGWRDCPLPTHPRSRLCSVCARNAQRAHPATNGGYRFAAPPRRPTCRPIAGMQCLLYQTRRQRTASPFCAAGL